MSADGDFVTVRHVNSDVDAQAPGWHGRRLVEIGQAVLVEVEAAPVNRAVQSGPRPPLAVPDAPAP